MHVWLDIRGIVQQQIEHIVALMLVGANNGGIDRDMVGHQCVGDHPFVQPEVFRRMAGIDRVEPAYGCRRSTVVQPWAFSVSFKGGF